MTEKFPIILAEPNCSPVELLKSGKKQIYKLQFSLFSSQGHLRVLAYPKIGQLMIELPCKEEWHKLFEYSAKTFVIAQPLKLNGHFIALKIFREAADKGWD